METPVTVVILAAGLGTRMKSRKAKVLHRAGGKTLVEHVVDTALELAPPERIFVVVGHQAEEVRQALAGRGVGFIEQKEQKGTGHALMVGRDAPGAPGRLSGGVLRRWSAAARRHPAAADRDAEVSGGGAGVLLSADMDDPDRLRPRDSRRGRRRDRGSGTEGRARRNNSPSAKPTWGSTAIARTCSGSTWTRSCPTIRPANTTSPTWWRFSPAPGHRMEAMRIDDAARSPGHQRSRGTGGGGPHSARTQGARIDARRA